MGEAYLVRRIGGGSSDFTVFSYDKLEDMPSSQPEGTVAVITTRQVGSVYVQREAPAAAAVGTLFFSSAGADANILKVGTVNFYSTGAFIRTETGWEAVDTYVFRGNAWVFAPSGKLYDTGNEYSTYTGNFVARKITSKSDASATTYAPTVTRNADSIVVITNASPTRGAGMWTTENMIDLTPYKTIVFEGTWNSEFTNYPTNFVAGAWSQVPKYYLDDRLAFVTMAKSASTDPLTIDVTDINTKAYIGIGMAYAKATITKIYMIPKEEA